MARKSGNRSHHSGRRSDRRTTAWIPFIGGIFLVMLVVAAVELYLSFNASPVVRAEGRAMEAAQISDDMEGLRIQGFFRPVTLGQGVENIELTWGAAEPVDAWRLTITASNGVVVLDEGLDATVRAYAVNSASLPLDTYAVSIQGEGASVPVALTGQFTLREAHEIIHAQIGLSRQLLAYLDQSGVITLEDNIAGGEYAPSSGEKPWLKWRNIAQIAVGSNHLVALTTDGKVVGVGENDNGQLNCVDLTGVRRIAAGNECTACVMDDGEVRLFGTFTDAQYALSQASNVDMLSISETHVVVQYIDGTAECYPLFNDHPIQHDGMAEWADLKQVSAGYDYTLGLRKDGTVCYAGPTDGDTVDCAQWTDMQTVAAGNGYALGLKMDSTVVSAGNPKLTFIDVSDWKDVADIAVCFDQCVALTRSGAVLRSKM